MIRTLSCHCGAVRLEVNAELANATALPVVDGACSIGKFRPMPFGSQHQASEWVPTTGDLRMRGFIGVETVGRPCIVAGRMTLSR